MNELVRFAFDADAVLFSDASQVIYDTEGLMAFHASEDAAVNIPLDPGPHANFLRKLAALKQATNGDEEYSPVRLALVTARNAPAEKRVLLTLRGWGVYVDAAYFLGRWDKTAILRAFRPHLRGTLFDRQEVIAHGGLPAALHPRANLTSGDLFEIWPAKGDAIFLAQVLHDWGDDDAGRILARAKEALLPGGSLYIVEMILLDDGPGGGLLDLNMAVMTGGRERTRGDWRKLLGSAGFALKRIIPLSTTPSIIVAGEPSP